MVSDGYEELAGKMGGDKRVVVKEKKRREWYTITLGDSYHFPSPKGIYEFTTYNSHLDVVETRVFVFKCVCNGLYM